MAFTSTRLCRCRVVFSGPFRNASLFYASCVPSGGRYRLQCSSRLLLQSSFLDWTIVTAFCFDFITRLQSVQNAVARLIFRIGRSEHLFTRSPTFTGCASQSASPSIHGTSPSSLQSCFTRVADTTSRRRLRSSVQRRLSSPRSTARSTLYSRQAGFPVTGRQHMWNDLPFHVTSAQSLAVFRQRLKTFLFSRSYPDILI